MPGEWGFSMKGFIKEITIFLALVFIFTAVILKTQVIPVQALKDQLSKDNVATTHILYSPIVSPSPSSVPDPLTLSIPSIGVNAHIEDVGMDSQGRMDVPTDWWDVGWYKLGPKPGQKGNVVIDGHLDSPTGPAVFWHLQDIVPGEQVVVTDASGNQYTYVVSTVKTYSYDQVPLTLVFGPSDQYNLNLITCTGVFDRTSKNYSERQVVYSTLE